MGEAKRRRAAGPAFEFADPDKPAIKIQEKRDDREFFERNPLRRYRWRLATKGEADAYLASSADPLPNEHFVFAAVRKISKRDRLRTFVSAPVSALQQTDKEDMARAESREPLPVRMAPNDSTS
jgi:hypothetical protein